MAQDEDTLLDLDNLDSLDVSGLETAPEFIEPEDGRYELTVAPKIESYDEKMRDSEGKPTGETQKSKRIRFTYSIVKTIQLKNKNALQPADGSLFSETFKCTAKGMSYWKQRCVAILGDVGKATVKEVHDELAKNMGFIADVKVKTTTGKDDEGNKREYSNINVRVLGDATQEAELPK